METTFINELTIKYGDIIFLKKDTSDKAAFLTRIKAKLELKQEKTISSFADTVSKIIF